MEILILTFRGADIVSRLFGVMRIVSVQLLNACRQEILLEINLLQTNH